MFVAPEAIHALLRAGANPCMTDDVLMWAARAGADTAISMLVRAGAHVDASDDQHMTALHWAAFPELMYSINVLAVALELVRHAGHLLDWDMRTQYGDAPLDWAQFRALRYPDDEDSQRILELYRTRRLPDGAQYLPTPYIVGVEDEAAEDDISGLPSTSLIRAGLRGDIEAIGDLIHRGAMVNERDREGRTLLHLVALGMVPHGYRVALELVRHGGWGVDWNAFVMMAYTVVDDHMEYRQHEPRDENDHGAERFGEDAEAKVHDSRDKDEDEISDDSADSKKWTGNDVCGGDDAGEERETDDNLENQGPSTGNAWWTPLAIADYRLRHHDLSAQEREELEKIWILLRTQRLPPDEEYLWPCMDPDFYARMPGAWE